MGNTLNPIAKFVRQALLAAGCTEGDIQLNTVCSGFFAKQEGGTVIVTHWIPSAWLFKIPYPQRQPSIAKIIAEYRIVLQKANYNVRDCGDHLRVE